MKMPKKICAVITARPSYSRIKSALYAIEHHPDLQLQLVVAGSALLDRYGETINIIEADGFKVDEKVFMVLEGENKMAMAKTTGLGVIELANAFFNLRPDAVITIADRYETIATSIAASYQSIPLIHIQGGEVTGNIDEKVRHANTKFADLHLVASEEGRQRVIKLGEEASKVVNTGCPSIDLARKVYDHPSLGFDPFKKYGGVGSLKNVEESNYLVVLQHPETTTSGKSRFQIEQTLEAVFDLGIPTLWFWPNIDAGSDEVSGGIRSFREQYNPSNIHFFKNMEPEDFLRLINNSSCFIGNSSTGIRECSFLGVPVVNIGNRQYRRQRGLNVMDVDYNKEDIIRAINQQINKKYSQQFIYGNGDSGERIANEIAKFDFSFHKTIRY
jgi:UDP-N-acetylglucosamine 2-epimerase/N-acetylmannosamine kinase